MGGRGGGGGGGGFFWFPPRGARAGPPCCGVLLCGGVCVVWVALLFAVTSVATALAPSFAGFVVARFLGGLAVGGVSLLSPMYVAEVSPAPIRGRMGTFYQLSIVIGILVSYGTNYLLRNSGANNWRWMFLTGVLPSMVFVTLVALAPESPRFLVRIGKT